MEQTLDALARPRHGLVTRELVLARGVSRDEIDERVARGALIRVHRGVYRVGHAAPSTHAAYLAAVLACGRGALLGGLAACWLLGLVSDDPPEPTVWAPGERRVRGVVCRRYRHAELRKGSRTVQGIPTIAVPRALVEAAALLSLADLATACHEAGIKYRTTPRQVAAVLRSNAKGAGDLRLVLGGEVQAELSRLETAFVRLLRSEGLPRPVTNKVASGRRVDCRWPDHGLTVELDSFTFHNSRHAWERDRKREREAYARGDEFRRYTWGDVFDDRVAMLAELHGLLS